MTAVLPDIISTSESVGRSTAADRMRVWLLQEMGKGRFASGSPIKESALARECGVSRNAMREALSQLVGAGLLEYQPYCGYRAREYTLRDLLEWYELREAVEPIAARRLARARPKAVLTEIAAALAAMVEALLADDIDAAKRFDLDFHCSMVSGCGNRSFAQVEVISRIMMTMCFKRCDELKYRAPSTLRHLDHIPTRDEFEEKDRCLTIEKHQEIYNAIARGDVRAAERSAQEHASDQVRNMESLPLEMLDQPLWTFMKSSFSGNPDQRVGI